VIESSRRSSIRGQALVEFALVAPIFFLLIFAIIDFGRYVYYVQVINNAAREGARYAIVHGSQGIPSSGPPAPGTSSFDPSGALVISAVKNYAVGVIGSDAILNVTPTWDPNNGRNSIVKVAVSYQFTSMLPLVPLPSVEITGESTLVVNN